MTMLYQHDFAAESDGQELSTITATVGSIAKHPDFTANGLITSGGKLMANGQTRYLLPGTLTDGNVSVMHRTILNHVLFGGGDAFAVNAPLSQMQNGSPNTSYNGLVPWNIARAAVWNGSGWVETGNEILYPHGLETWIRYEQYNGFLQTFVHGCEAVRAYLGNPPSLTTERPGFGTNGGHNLSVNCAPVYSIEIETGTTRPLIGCFGDSLTRGQTGTVASPSFVYFEETWPTRMSIRLGKGQFYDVLNMGSPGYTVNQIMTVGNATSQTGAQPDNFRFGGRLTNRPTASMKIAFIFAGANDIITGRTAAQIIGDLETAATTLRGEGWDKIVFITLTHNSHPTYGGSAYNDKADDVNIGIRASSACDEVLDIAADAYFSDPDDTDVFSDGLHMTPAGYDKISEGAAAIATNLLTGGSPRLWLPNSMNGGLLTLGL